MAVGRLTAGAAVLAAAGFAAYTMAAGPETACPPHILVLENHGTAPVDILAISWLNSAETTWMSTPVPAKRIAPGANWQTDVALTGLTTPQTFVRAHYKRAGQAGGEREATSEQVIRSCQKDRQSILRIVDKR